MAEEGCRSLIKEMQEITIEKAMRNEQKCITTMKGLQLFDIETCINSPGNYSCQCLKGCKHEGMDEKSCIKDNKLSKAILLIISLGEADRGRGKLWFQHSRFCSWKLRDEEHAQAALQNLTGRFNAVAVLNLGFHLAEHPSLQKGIDKSPRQQSPCDHR
ncbi:uncharacterized protein LOC126633482 [Malus sylvestris]|uniref:uncharacterized protein LOC126633482 n=1 Tax=Malus sylvestris TaxID=3752 RepID=UPI0021AC98AB|nr:uncharacterized protein LOC126633482 [Malus sylvestris]XP_050160056.1 uncharacterized protein LOC126633482 [Malus sylvestris]